MKIEIRLNDVGHFHDRCRTVNWPFSGRRLKSRSRPASRDEERIMSALGTGRFDVFGSNPVIQTSCMKDMAAGGDFDQFLFLEAV